MFRKSSSVLILTAFMVVGLSGCSADENEGPKKNADVEQRIANVKAMMKDPYSARFTNLKLMNEVLGYKGPTGLLALSGEFGTVEDLTLCGEVNAKNSNGGYTGPKPFVAATNLTLVYQEAAGFELAPIYSGSEAMIGWSEEQAARREAEANNQAIRTACSLPGTPVTRPDDVN
ncbi:hypothetical protein [Brevundimonas sp.]|uniref:hypothetical protein n=1 Tax=Brevundimonas sp. TaxID=1871086 RepID=UPI0035B18C5D